jgi:hypothetical protein
LQKRAKEAEWSEEGRYRSKWRKGRCERVMEEREKRNEAARRKLEEDEK